MVDMYVSLVGPVHHVDDGVFHAPPLTVLHDSFDSNMTLKMCKSCF